MDFLALFFSQIFILTGVKVIYQQVIILFSIASLYLCLLYVCLYSNKYESCHKLYFRER